MEVQERFYLDMSDEFLNFVLQLTICSTFYRSNVMERKVLEEEMMKLSVQELSTLVSFIRQVIDFKSKSSLRVGVKVRGVSNRTGDKLFRVEKVNQKSITCREIIISDGKELTTRNIWRISPSLLEVVNDV
jgi:hypothetical protein